MKTNANVKRLSLVIAITFCFLFHGFAIEKPKVKDIPNIPGYMTLKCDFHIHTTFSDGKVSPAVRVQEASKDGLDVIALTDHNRFGKPNKSTKDLNGAYEIAAKEAKNTDLIVIKGIELTYSSPPGHFNALFLKDAQKFESADFWVAFEEAKKQDAFFIWNHPLWKAPDSMFVQNGIAEWTDTHSRLHKKGMLMGIEVVNNQKYIEEAHQWGLDKGLTMFGNSDIHKPISSVYQDKNRERPLTLVFAKERSEQGIKEALLHQRTVVQYNGVLIGKEELLTPLLHAMVSVKNVTYYENVAELVLHNESGIDLVIENTSEYSFVNSTKFMTLKAGEKKFLGIKTGIKMDSFKLRFEIMNFLTAPDKSLIGEFECKVGDTKPRGKKGYR